MTRSHGWVNPRGLIDPPGEIAVEGSPLRLYERGFGIPESIELRDSGQPARARGLTISSWCLEQHTEAEELCWALLWLNPADNQGASRLLREIASGAPGPHTR